MASTSKEADEQACLDISNRIQELVKALPKDTVPLAEKSGKIYTVIRTSTGDTAWETFDKRFNALYGADQYDRETQRLLHIERGKYGLDAVCQYLTLAVGIDGIPHALMMPKLERLKTELEYIWCVHISAGAINGESDSLLEQRRGCKSQSCGESCEDGYLKEDADKETCRSEEERAERAEELRRWEPGRVDCSE